MLTGFDAGTDEREADFTVTSAPAASEGACSRGERLTP